MASDYLLWNNYPLLLDMIINDANEQNIDLKKDYSFHNMDFVTTKDGQNGVVIVYAANLKEDKPYIFFVYKHINDEFICI